MKKNPVVKIFSFGFQKSGIPVDRSNHHGGFVFDCRFLPNPGREKQYQNKTGLDQEVINYFSQYPVVENFLAHVYEIIDLAVNNYTERGFSQLMLSFGCTGGQHRSVYCAGRLRNILDKDGVITAIKHIELPEIMLAIKMNRSLTQSKIQNTDSASNAGVTNSAIRFCDLTCGHASFPREEGIDGAKSCRTFSALWCNLLKEYVVKNSPCSVEFGKRRPTAGW